MANLAAQIEAVLKGARFAPSEEELYAVFESKCDWPDFKAALDQLRESGRVRIDLDGDRVRLPR